MARDHFLARFTVTRVTTVDVCMPLKVLRRVSHDISSLSLLNYTEVVSNYGFSSLGSSFRGQ